MSEESTIKEQQSVKATKAYVAPRLRVYGEVEKITKASGTRGGDGSHLGHSRF